MAHGDSEISKGIESLKREFDHVNHIPLMVAGSVFCNHTIERDMPFSYNAVAYIIRINLRQAKNGEIEDMARRTRDMQRYMQEIYDTHVPTDWVRLEMGDDIERASKYGSFLCHIDGFWIKSLSELERMKTQHERKSRRSQIRILP